MKLRPIFAWGLFLAVLALPTSILVATGYYFTADAAARLRHELFEARVQETAQLRQELELSMLRSGEVLRSVPCDATPDMAATAIGAGSSVFQVAFIAHGGAIEIPVPQDAKSPASDPAIREEMRRSLNEDRSVFAFARGAGVRFGTQEVRYIRTESVIIALRDVRHGLRVGWIADARTLTHGADGKLAGRNKLEHVPAPDPLMTPATPTDINPDTLLRPSSGIGDPVFSIKLSKEPARMPAQATPEDATLVSLGKNLTFRVVPRVPGYAENAAARARRWSLAIVFGAIGSMVILAIWMFRRARSAQHLADLRTDFVAAVSHELRTPLASVRMFAELLEAGAVEEDERPEVEQALAGETRRLHATLDRMLRFGALARGQLVLAKSTQRIAPILEAASRKRTVKIEVDPDLEANVDGELLGLAVDNLLSNAVKYAPADEDAPHVLRARREGDVVVIDVVDHGPGLSKKALKKVFLPFERADQRLSRATEGSGVGLALVRGIARAHGGDATVTSILGSGATFTLRLPCS